ncbi:MAG: 16S rRNA (cytidine(1402)-2'-O)-methyltransferase [Chloroflexi bacterium]|nr:16S rRNA (cytidine(1402)-2'-O)-methyltransferase [Chloroflexota bacterium]
MGRLYIVPTPIGNLEDITLRALRILGEVSLIAAEDTRTTGRLLAHFEIKTRQISYHEHNKLTRLDQVLAALVTGDVALVSDAGTPGLSDPGYELVRAAIDQGVRVEPLPGASALLPALVASGLPTDRFVFLGFLPRKQASRQAELATWAEVLATLACYEAPHRLLATLEDISTVLGERQIVVARELSKLHEEIWRGTPQAALEHFSSGSIKGEITLLIAGASPQAQVLWTEDQVREALAARLADGESRSAAAKTIAKESGWPRRVIYDLDV